MVRFDKILYFAELIDLKVDGTRRHLTLYLRFCTTLFAEFVCL